MRVVVVVICLMRLTWEVASQETGTREGLNWPLFCSRRLYSFPFQILVATKEAPKSLKLAIGSERQIFDLNPQTNASYKLHSYKGKSNRVMAPPSLCQL